MFKLTTIGDCTVDTHLQIDSASVECDLDNRNCKLCLDFASKIPITGSFQSMGGDAANVAVGAVTLGLTTAIITTLGKDSNGQIIKTELQRSGVDSASITIDPSAPTRYSVVLNFRGERTILSFHHRRLYRLPRQMPKSDWIYYTGMSEGFEPLQASLSNYLQKHQSVRLAFNPGSYQLKAALTKVKEMLPRSDILILNLEEAEMVLGTSLKKEKSVTALLRKFIDLEVKEVAITDAARGAWAGNNTAIYHLDTYPVEVEAKTGAGDAFSSGYMAARIYGHDIPTALQWGIANSCGVIQEVGAQKGLLDKKGMAKMIKKYQHIRPTEIS